MQIFIHCKVNLHVWVSQHPSSGVLKTVTATSGTGHNTGTATDRDWFVLLAHTSPDQATLEGSSCTNIMTCTGGCGYSFSTPDGGCCDTRNMYSDFAVNKYLHTVASGSIFINIAIFFIRSSNQFDYRQNMQITKKKNQTKGNMVTT